MHMLILHYAVIQLRYSTVPRQDSQDQEGRESDHARRRREDDSLSFDPLSRAGARLRARVGRIQVSTQAGQTFRVSPFL